MENMKTYLIGAYCLDGYSWRVHSIFAPATLVEQAKIEGYAQNYFYPEYCTAVGLRRITVPEKWSADDLIWAYSCAIRDDYQQEVYKDILKQCKDSNQPYKDLDIDYAKMRRRRLGIMPSLDELVDGLIGKLKK